MPKLVFAFLTLSLSLWSQTLTTNAATLRFTATVGSTTLPTAQSVSVQSAPPGGGFTVAVTGPAPHFAGWLLVSASSGRAPQTLSVQVNPTGLAAGSYTGTITLTGTTGQPPPTTSIAVTLVIGTPPPVITVSPTAVSFNYTTSQPVAGNPALTSTFILSNTGAATAASLSVQAAPWLRVTPTGNITLAGLFNSINVTVDPTGLAPKVYTANITIKSTGTANPTLTVPVTLNVVAASPNIFSTWPLGVIQQSAQSFVTIYGENYFANSTVSATGFTNESTITATDGVTTSSETFYIPVYPSTATALRIPMGSPMPAGTVSAVYTAVNLTAAGGTSPYSWSLAGGQLPPGINLNGNQLTGTPTAAGTYYFTLQVEDSTSPINAVAYMPFKMNVMPASVSALRVTGPTSVMAAGTLSSTYPSGNGAASAGAAGPLTWSATGLPSGMSINTTTGALGGVPGSVGLQGNLTSRQVGENAMLVTVPASFLLSPGYLRMAVTTPNPGGGTSSEAQFQVYGPRPQVNAVVDSASYAQGTISPGQLLTLFGLGLGPTSLTLFNPTSPAPQIPSALPTTGPATSVSIGGIAAPILYTSANQASVVVPYNVSGASADLVLNYNGLASQPVSLTLAPTTPGVYTTDASGRGQGAILNFNLATNDYTLNSNAAPALKGGVAVLYVSGIGATNASTTNPTTAAATLIPQNAVVTPVGNVSVTIGGIAASVIGAISPIGSVPGLLQINVSIPANAPAGAAVPVLVNIGGVDSQPGVTMAIK
jgi:trimeric autotransporter adhesin